MQGIPQTCPFGVPVVLCHSPPASVACRTPGGGSWAALSCFRLHFSLCAPLQSRVPPDGGPNGHQWLMRTAILLGIHLNPSDFRG